MGMPRTLKNFNVFNDGESCIGQVVEVALPKLSRKLEDYRAGGMNGPVGVDLGNEKLEMEQTFGGLMRTVLNQYGITNISGVQLRFAGAYQRDDTGEVDAVEVVVRGRHNEIDMGSAKAGDKNEFKVKSQLTYYKLSINGETVIDIDLLNMVENVNGVDRLAEQRRAIGL